MYIFWKILQIFLFSLGFIFLKNAKFCIFLKYIAKICIKIYYREKLQ